MSTSYHTPDSSSATIEYLPLVDYLSFTVKVDSCEQLHGEALLWLDVLGGGTVRDKGLHGYTHAYTCAGGSGVICWRPDRLDMGVHVVLPGSALALLPEYGGSSRLSSDGLTPESLIRLVIESGGTFSRLDVNQDSSDVTIDEVAAAIESPALVTKARGRRRIVSYTRDDESSPWWSSGTTHYIGSRSSDRLVRFYDKAAEQGVEGTWVRCEAEFKGDAAHAAALHLAAGRSVCDLIVSVVDFRNPEDDTNVSRRSRCSWWERWIGTGARVSFARAKVDEVVERALAWVESAVAPTLAMLSIAGADLRELLYRVTDRGFGRLDSSRRRRAIEYRESGYQLFPAIPPALRDVYTDVEAWVINSRFATSEALVA